MVQEEAGGHFLAERGAEFAAQAFVCCQVDGCLDVGVAVGRGPFLVANGREDRETNTRGVAVSGDGNDGNAHPEGFTGSGGAVVGERVERDIHAGVGGEVFLSGGKEAKEFDPGLGKACRGDSFHHAGPRFGVLKIGALEQEAGAGNLSKNEGPGLEDFVGDFEKIIKGCEGDRGSGFGHAGEGSAGRGFVGPGAR